MDIFCPCLTIQKTGTKEFFTINLQRKMYNRTKNRNVLKLTKFKESKMVAKKYNNFVKNNKT